MAVIQISKIQVRRGQRNVTGVPQLSSAEFAWAVDSQELFIGNGSVAEGAPYVGNTKILTEHDNILDLAASYRFGASDASITDSIDRSLASKLDEYVSVLDFGAVPDGSTDCTLAFQTAFEQLYKNPDTKFRKVLTVPNGTYLFASTLNIPPNVIIQGETRDNTVLYIDASNIQFTTSDGLTLSASNRPKNVNISNLTISRSSGEVDLTGLADSTFTNVKFQGEYVLSSTAVSLTTEYAAIKWSNTALFSTSVTGIKFNDCLFDSNPISVKCTQNTVYNTYVDFNNCEFFVSDTAIYINGVSGQGNNWNIINCKFEEIAQQVFRSTNGYNTKIVGSDFINCGNGNGQPNAPINSIVYFGEKNNNVLLNCNSNRLQALSNSITTTTLGLPEAENADRYVSGDRIYTSVTATDGFRPFTAISAFSRYVVVDYYLNLDGYSRTGQLTLSIGDVLENVDDAIGTSAVAVTDNFQYSPSVVLNPGGALMTNFEFAAQLADNDNDSGFDTVLLLYKNPLSYGKSGTLSFNITYGV